MLKLLCSTEGWVTHSVMEEKSATTLEGQRTVECVTNEKWKDNYSQLSWHEVSRSLHLHRGYSRGDGGVRDPNRQKMRFQSGAVWLLREQATAVWRHSHQFTQVHIITGTHTHTHTHSVNNWSTPWHFEDQLRILQHLLHRYYMTWLSSMAKSTSQPSV